MRLIDEKFCERIVRDKNCVSVPDSFEPLIRPPKLGYQWLWTDFSKAQFIEVPVFVYHKATKEPCQVLNLDYLNDPIYTEKAPEDSSWVVWSEIDNNWIIDQQAQFEAAVKAVNDIRRQKYAQLSDPLLSESLMLRELGEEVAADATKQQALEWYEKIKLEHPWPENPNPQSPE
ncbi:hypothetical protein KCG43_20365 [Photobacterium sp. WH24]|uniref:hypothetical protein n=1 Tax=Photobacterium sp. WH24 TaxID=2827237 RepID=UPI001C46B7EB|nr:hypothetical protein [Photobacterium sp. WH24]MBV7264369.1 hypothetical protein [Photobacterium sp. WH24]